MDIDLSDLTVFVYNAGVVLSGGYVAITFDLTSPEIVPVSLALGLLWTVYYQSAMVDKLPPFDDEDKNEMEPPVAKEKRDEEEPTEQSGPDAPWE